MKTRPRIRTVAGIAIAFLAFSAMPVNAADYKHIRIKNNGPVYDYARVLSAEPIIRYVTVDTPVRECWEETEYYTVERPVRGTAGGTILGAIVGGVIGHQFGGGRGKDVATALGSVVGAAVGNDAAHRRRELDGYRTTRHSRPVTRCETTYQSRQEERIDGYHVVYKYHGQKYATRTRHDPGSRLRIRVDVRPAV